MPAAGPKDNPGNLPRRYAALEIWVPGGWAAVFAWDDRSWGGDELQQCTNYLCRGRTQGPEPIDPSTKGEHCAGVANQLAPLRPLSWLEMQTRRAAPLGLHSLCGTLGPCQRVSVGRGSHEAAAGRSTFSPGALHRSAGVLPGGMLSSLLHASTEAGGRVTRSLSFRRGGPTPRSAPGESRRALCSVRGRSCDSLSACKHGSAGPAWLPPTARRRRQASCASTRNHFNSHLPSAAQPGRLGSDEEHWSAPRGDAPAAQAAERQPGTPADRPAEQQQQHGFAQQHDEHDSQHGMEGGHDSDLPPAVQAQQPKDQGAAADDAARAAGAAQVQQQQAPTQEQEQPAQPQTAAEQPGERQAGGLAGTVPSPQAEQPAEQQQQQASGTPSAGQQQQQQQQNQRQQAQQQQQEASDTPSAGQQQQQQQQQQPQLRCAVINNVSTHLDVAAGVAWALQVCTGGAMSCISSCRLLSGHCVHGVPTLAVPGCGCMRQVCCWSRVLHSLPGCSPLAICSALPCCALCRRLAAA